MQVIFWSALITIIYIYIGYPAMLLILSFLRNKPVKKADIEPNVSVVIPAYNEELVIEEKIRNTLSLDYPREKLEIIIASDGSTDATADIVKKYVEHGIRLFDYPARRGKPGVLNEIVPQARGEIIIFTDASGMLENSAVRKLVRNFGDPLVGCVCGDYKFSHPDSTLRGQGESMFVKYELFIKKKEAQIGSILGLHGAIYAIRKELYFNLEEDTINDDYIIPARIVERGFRSVFEEEAVVYERQGLDMGGEFRRRIRMAAGNCQLLYRLKPLLNPLRGMIFIEFFSHKVLRTMTPPLLIMLFISNIFLTGKIYTFIFLSQVSFYALAIAGYAMERKRVYLRYFYAPFYFCMSNIAVALGMLRFLCGTQGVRWQR